MFLILVWAVKLLRVELPQLIDHGYFARFLIGLIYYYTIKPRLIP